MSGVERVLLLNKIREWQEKARREEDPFNKYVSIYVAYNIFYNLLWKDHHPDWDLAYGDKYRSTCPLELISQPNVLISRLQPLLSEYADFIPVYREEYWEKERQIPISESLRISLREGWHIDTLEMLLKWFYKVRCNLVHGDKNYDDEKQRRLLKMSSTLLDTILSNLL